MKVKFSKIIVSTLVLTFIMINICLFKVSAHNINLGVSGYEGITYDQCIPYSEDLTEAGNSDGETWYGLVSTIGLDKIMAHIDDDIDTIYYKIHDTNENDEDANWTEDAELYKSFIKIGIDTWNCVSVYRTNERGNLYPTRLVNFVDVDTVENGDEIIPNINIYPMSKSGGSVSGGCNIVYESEVVEDRQVFNGIEHRHFTQYDLFLLPNVIRRNFDLLFSTVSHEMGHVLGLADVDSEEYSMLEQYHHQEILMGYSLHGEKQIHITYRDLSGVMITRGLHTNDNHQWMYDETSSVEGNHKLICCLCNCVKYVVSLEGYEYVRYQQCMDGCTYDEAHTLSSGNMIPVARYLDKDYWKCKYCRYVCWFNARSIQNYLYTGIYNNNYHVLENHVNGLEYTIEEPHSYSIDLGNGVYKCNHCPSCSDGSVYVDDMIDCTLQCIMSEYNSSTTLAANQSSIYKLNVECLNEYRINFTGNKDLILEIFDDKFQLTNSIVLDTTISISKSINHFFEKGTSYIRIRLNDYTDTGDYSLSISSCDDCYNTRIYSGESIRISNHHHSGYTEFIYYANNPGLIKFTLNGQNNISNSVLSEGSIVVKTLSGDVVKKYEFNSYNNLSRTNNGQSYIYAYLSQSEDYIIEINCPVNYVQYFNFSVEDLNDCNRNEYNVFEDEEEVLISNNLLNQDIVSNITPMQNSNYQLNIVFESEGNSTNSGLLLIVSKVDITDYLYTTNIIYQNTLSSDRSYSINLDMYNNKEYYVCYLGNNLSGTIDVTVKQFLVNHEHYIITDPDSLTNCGTEVSMNGGVYRGNTITQGYSRICYFSNDAPSKSRLDYYWYISDEELAEVSSYGTVLAHNIEQKSTVQVIAVYKRDMSIVIRINFTLLKFTKYLNSFSYNLTVSLSDSSYLMPVYDEWPSKIRQNYDWEVFNGCDIEITSWGKLVPIEVGTCIIYAEYKYNSQYRMYFRITVVE